MRRIRKVVEHLAFGVLVLCGLGMMIAMFLGTGDVVGTQFFGWPIPGAKEMTESTMVLIVFGALTYAQIRRGHIRVELLYTRANDRTRAAMDSLADLAALVFFGLLLWQAIGEGIMSWHIREADVGLIRFPLYPARWVLVAGTALVIVQLLLDLVIDVQRMRGKASPEMLEGLPDQTVKPAPKGGD
jgi:TRAP-type C4-dicarboxylate transport system permease small subunit